MSQARYLMKKYLFTYLMYLVLGCMVAVIQEIVLHGFPLQLGNEIWGEILYAFLYLSVLISFQKWLLSRHIRKEINEVFSVESLMKVFLWQQIAGFLWFFSLAVILELITTGKLPEGLKAVYQLRFILIYYFMLNALVFGVGISIRLYMLFSLEREAKHRAEKSYMSAQLQMLRQQLNPHFLFNNLNIIASTIHSNPQLAYDFTRSMASFYRKVLETEGSGWVTLRHELNTIRAYLYMLGVRFEDKLLFRIEVPEELQDQRHLPDFILLPVVENAVKHNLCSKKQPLEIVITLADDNTLLIKNSYQPRDASAESLGIGWFNIESRFQYLGGKTPVKYIRDGWFCVEVPLQIV